MIEKLTMKAMFEPTDDLGVLRFRIIKDEYIFELWDLDDE